MNSIPFSLKHGLLYIPVQLIHDGKVLLLESCIFDTGSGSTAFDADRAASIGLTLDPSSRIKRLTTAGGYQRVFTRIVDSFQLGQIKLTNIEIELGDLASRFEIDGIIGTDIIRQCNWELDFQNNSLKMAPRFNQKKIEFELNKLMYWARDQRVDSKYVNITVNDFAALYCFINLCNKVEQRIYYTLYEILENDLKKTLKTKPSTDQVEKAILELLEKRSKKTSITSWIDFICKELQHKPEKFRKALKRYDCKIRKVRNRIAHYPIQRSPNIGPYSYPQRVWHDINDKSLKKVYYDLCEIMEDLEIAKEKEDIDDIFKKSSI